MLFFIFQPLHSLQHSIFEKLHLSSNGRLVFKVFPGQSYLSWIYPASGCVTHFSKVIIVSVLLSREEENASRDDED